MPTLVDLTIVGLVIGGSMLLGYAGAKILQRLSNMRDEYYAKLAKPERDFDIALAKIGSRARPKCSHQRVDMDGICHDCCLKDAVELGNP